MDGNIDFEGANKEYKSTIFFNPRIELNNIVDELCAMIKNFSGEGAQSNPNKTSNSERCSNFFFLYEFEDIYFRSRDPGFKFEFMDRLIVRECDIYDNPCCYHFGPNQKLSENKYQVSSENPTFWIVRKCILPNYSSGLFFYSHPPSLWPLLMYWKCLSIGFQLPCPPLASLQIWHNLT